MWGRTVFCWLTVVCTLGAALRSPGRAQSCPGEECAGDTNCDNQVTIDEILTVVNNALDGCPATISPDQACTDYASAECAKLDMCVINGTTARYGGPLVCRARQKQACLTRLAAPGTGNDPTAVEQCLQQIPSASCNEFDLGEIAECQAKTGSIANGQACAFSGQCQSANCAIVTGTSCGTCAPPNQAGDSCATTSCSAGLFCIAATQQCQPRGSGDAACDSGHPCGAGLSCVTPSGMPSGTCQPAGATVGAACDPSRQTAPACDPNLNLRCDGTSHTCLADSFTGAGAQCGVVNHIGVSCTNASTCFGAQGQTPGMCLANAADGGPCDTQAGPSCLPPARCVTGGGSATAGLCRLADPASCS